MNEIIMVMNVLVQMAGSEVLVFIIIFTHACSHMCMKVILCSYVTYSREEKECQIERHRKGPSHMPGSYGEFQSFPS